MNSWFVTMTEFPFTTKAASSYKLIDIDELMQDLEGEVERELDIQERMFLATTRTWRHEVKFEKDYKWDSDMIIGRVWTDDEIYFYLDRGTSVRYATMNPRFKSKTHVRTLGSGQGRYPDPEYVSKKIPRPGIQAREWSDEIYQRRKPEFIKRYNRVIQKFVNKHMRRYSKGR